ncbi:MAG: peptide MFS transporter [Proteobacteria bacterium]|nr:peptide MFS transporter [Pseudomonadota bacterium]
MSAAEARPAEPRWFGQPPGLTILFLTEMWEKFSYYGMRALLVLYMTTGLKMAQAKSSEIYGHYILAAYLTPFLGALVADRLIGRRRAVIFGGLVMAAGHFMMGFETLFYPALATIAFGNGFFLPNLPSQVRGLYKPGDPRLSSAYSIYYLGINLGAVLAGVVCGVLQQVYGWHYGFGAAGVGMTLGVLIYAFGGRWLPKESEVRAQADRSGRVSPSKPGDILKRLLLLAGVVLVVIIFRGAYEQLGNTIVLWSDHDVSRPVLFGWEIPAPVFQSLNPAVVMLVTPLLVWWWIGLAKRGREPSLIVKMTTGAVITALSFLMIAAVSWFDAKAGAKTSWLWLAGFIALMTLGELWLLPVGLALFGRIAPERLGSFTIAIWFVATGFGSELAGRLGTYWSKLSHAEFFVLMAGCALLAGLLLLIFDGPVKRTVAGGEADVRALEG